MKSSVTTRSSSPFLELQGSNPSNNAGYFPDDVPNLIADEKRRRLKEFRKIKAVQESQAGHRPSHHHYNHDHHIHKRRRSSTTVSRCTPSPTLVEGDSASSQDDSKSYDHGDGILTMPPRSLQEPPRLSKTRTQQRDELQHILLAPQPMRVRRPRPMSLEHSRRLTSSTHAGAYMKEQQHSSSWGVHEHPFDLEHREEYSSDQQAVARNETWQNMHLHPLTMSSDPQHRTHMMNGHQLHSRFPSAMSRGSSSLATRRIDPYSYANSNHRRIRLGVQGLSYIDEESESSAGHSTTSYEVGHVDPHEMRSYAPALVSPRPLWLPSRYTAPPLPPPTTMTMTTRRENNRVPRALPPRRRIISQQPSRHPGMQYKVLNPRNAKGMPYDEKGKRDWSTDLCRFCDHNLGTCCKALWCPCIIYGRNKARIEYLYEEGKVHPTRGGTCSDNCMIHACLTTFCLFGWAMQVPNRATIRRRYDIEGDWLGDCAAALCCYPCELSQESREIDLEEGSFVNLRTPLTNKDTKT